MLVSIRFKPVKLFLLLLFAIPHFSFAQDTTTAAHIEIIGADLFEYNESGGKKMKTLSGNVQLRQSETLMYCDNAILSDDDNTLDASGRVRIVQDTVQLASDLLHYDGIKRKATFTNNVMLTDSKMKLTTQQLDYDLNTRIASYRTGAVLKNDSSTLTSLSGYYYAKTKDAYFKKDVTLTGKRFNLTADTLRFNTATRITYFLGPTSILSDSTRIYCEGGYYNTDNNTAQFITHARMDNPKQLLMADSIYHEKQTGLGIARGNVYWKDSSENISIAGNYVRYNENEESVFATKKPLLTSLIDNDSMYLTADTLLSVENGKGNRSFFAFHRVKIFKSNMQALCDSLSYSDADSVFRLFYNPVIWIDANQLKADTIKIFLANKNVKQINLLKSGFISNQADSSRFNQMKGKNIFGYFENGEMKKLVIEGNGESVYYAKDDSSAYIGVNKIVCSDMTIYLEDHEVKKILFDVKPEGTLYPVNQAPEGEIKLKNFIWLADKKPKSKEDLLK